MSLKNILLFISCVAAVLVGCLSTETDEKLVACYYGSWAFYRNGDGKFLVSDIQAGACTHLIYAFAGLDTHGRIVSLDPYLNLEDNWGKGDFKKFTSLKNSNPGLKTLISIGGWNEGSLKYSQMAADENKRKVFVDSVVEFCQKYAFDGLSLDWQYPGSRGGQEKDKENYVLLLQELHKEFEQQGLVLSILLPSVKGILDRGYALKEIMPLIDFASVLTFDYHGAWEGATGHNAPLYGRDSDSEVTKELNMNFTINYLMENGADPEKLLLGLPLYGRSFTLKDESENGVADLSTGPGKLGPFTGEGGFLGYHEICREFLKHSETSLQWDEEQNVPYAYLRDQWVSFDNEKSFDLKIQYAMEKSMGGFMIWSLENDDFRSKCAPLLNHLLRSLGRNITSISSTTSPDEEDVNHSSSTTGSNDGSFFCQEAGYFRDPEDCTIFHLCQANAGGYVQYTYTCPDGLVFNEPLVACDFLFNVQECQ